MFAIFQVRHRGYRGCSVFKASTAAGLRIASHTPPFGNHLVVPNLPTPHPLFVTCPPLGAMVSKTSWIRRFPWFMILVLILCAVLTALLVSTVNDARDTTEALLEHFRGIDAVLKLAMEVVRWAVFAEWVMLGLNVFGVRRSFASSEWNESSFVRRAQSRTCHIGQFGPIGQSARQTQASVAARCRALGATV